MAGRHPLRKTIEIRTCTLFPVRLAPRKPERGTPGHENYLITEVGVAFGVDALPKAGLQAMAITACT